MMDWSMVNGGYSAMTRRRAAAWTVTMVERVSNTAVDSIA
jgi:hypothetical protein